MIENNRLIAEFLGLDVSDTNGIFKKGLGVAYLTDDIFKKDWNWLMLVCNKIESLGFEAIIRGNYCGINNNSDNSINSVYYNESKTSKIEATYNACVQFVKWYNEKYISYE